MTAKEYLSQYRWLNAKIDSEIEQARRMRELATAISPSSGFGSPGDISDKVGKTVAKLVDAEEEINADIDRLVEEIYLKGDTYSARNGRKSLLTLTSSSGGFIVCMVGLCKN